MTGKLAVLLIVLSAVVAGGAIYYLQVYGYYYEVTDGPDAGVRLVPAAGGDPVEISVSDFRAIDADSSPIRYRACFRTDTGLEALSADYRAYDNAEPLTAPGWFDCFDAAALDEALKAGQARAYLGVKNVQYGVDRVVAITADGRGYAWQVLNNCGQKAYDGTVVGEACPPRPVAGN